METKIAGLKIGQKTYGAVTTITNKDVRAAGRVAKKAMKATAIAGLVGLALAALGAAGEGLEKDRKRREKAKREREKMRPGLNLAKDSVDVEFEHGQNLSDCQLKGDSVEFECCSCSARHTLPMEQIYSITLTQPWETGNVRNLEIRTVDDHRFKNAIPLGPDFLTLTTRIGDVRIPFSIRRWLIFRRSPLKDTIFIEPAR